MKTLVYTIALDPRGLGLFPAMARMLYASWNHSGNVGDFYVITDQEMLAPVSGKNFHVIVAPTGTPAYHIKAAAWKHLPLQEYDVVLFVDADCLFLRPFKLPSTKWDLLVQAGTGRGMTTIYYNSYLTESEMALLVDQRGINAGTFAVRAEHFTTICQAWLKTLQSPPLRPLWRAGSDQAAWNRVVLDFTKHAKVKEFPVNAVGFPFLKHDPKELAKARLLHFAAVGPEEAFSAMLNVYFDHFSAGGS